MLRNTFILAVVFMCGCGANNSRPRLASSAPDKPALVLLSDDLQDNGFIPAIFTCDGDNVSPSFKWSGAPAGTGSFILTVLDPDAPGGEFLHWAVVDIPPYVSSIARNSKFPPNSRELKNNFDAFAYGGPCPPKGRPHRYVFSLYAVDIGRFSDDPSSLGEFLEKHTLAKAVFTGLYARK